MPKDKYGLMGWIDLKEAAGKVGRHLVGSDWKDGKNLEQNGQVNRWLRNAMCGEEKLAIIKIRGQAKHVDETVVLTPGFYVLAEKGCIALGQDDACDWHDALVHEERLATALRGGTMTNEAQIESWLIKSFESVDRSMTKARFRADLNRQLGHYLPLASFENVWAKVTDQPEYEHWAKPGRRPKR